MSMVYCNHQAIVLLCLNPTLSKKDMTNDNVINAVAMRCADMLKCSNKKEMIERQ